MDPKSYWSISAQNTTLITIHSEWVSVKASLWNLDWTMDWTLDSVLD